MHMEHDLHLENHMVSAQSLERYYGPRQNPPPGPRTAQQRSGSTGYPLFGSGWKMTRKI